MRRPSLRISAFRTYQFCGTIHPLCSRREAYAWTWNGSSLVRMSTQRSVSGDTGAMRKGAMERSSSIIDVMRLLASGGPHAAEQDLVHVAAVRDILLTTRAFPREPGLEEGLRRAHVGRVAAGRHLVQPQGAKRVLGQE